MKKRMIFLMLVLLLVGCSQEIELDQPDYTSKVVVDGYIESNGYARIYLMRSSPFLTQYDSLSVLKTFINNASIKLTCSNGETELLTFDRVNGSFPPFVYRSLSMKGIPGQKYSLEIRTGGRILTAETSIPLPPASLAVTTQYTSDSTCRYQLDVSADTSGMHYLYLQYKSKLADKNYHPAGVPVFKADFGGGSQLNKISLMLYRCDETNLYLMSQKKYYKGWPKNDFSIDDELSLKLGVVDVQSYQILKSLFADEAVRNNPFAFNSAGIQSNIKGGIGRWTGIGLYPVRVIRAYPQ